MRVGILGAGAISFGAAAYLAQAGHDPIIWSPSAKRTVELAAGRPLIASDAISGTFLARVASSCADAIANADLVLFALPGYGHKFAFEAAAPHIRDGQPIVISSHLSFGALYLSKLLVARGINAPIIAWGTTLTTGRQISFTEVKVGNVRSKVDLATLPTSAIEKAHALCTDIW
jgi:opine dehydrogenase